MLLQQKIRFICQKNTLLLKARKNYILYKYKWRKTNLPTFLQVMGHMDVISIISDGFNVYFPMAILAFCLATYFSLGSRLLSVVGFQQFLEESDITTEIIEEGRELIKRGIHSLFPRNCNPMKLK